MEDFFKRHWLSLLIIGVLVYALYQLFNTANTAIAQLNPFTQLQKFIAWIFGLLFGNSSSSATPGAGGSQLAPVIPLSSQNLGNAFGLDAPTLQAQMPSEDDTFGEQ